MNLAHDTTNMHKGDSSGEKKGFGRGEEGIPTGKEGNRGSFSPSLRAQKRKPPALHSQGRQRGDKNGRRRRGGELDR